MLVVNLDDINRAEFLSNICDLKKCFQYLKDIEKKNNLKKGGTFYLNYVSMNYVSVVLQEDLVDTYIDTDVFMQSHILYFQFPVYFEYAFKNKKRVKIDKNKECLLFRFAFKTKTWFPKDYREILSNIQRIVLYYCKYFDYRSTVSDFRSVIIYRTARIKFASSLLGFLENFDPCKKNFYFLKLSDIGCSYSMTQNF